MFDVIKEILISEKDFPEPNYKTLQEALVCIKKMMEVYIQQLTL